MIYIFLHCQDDSDRFGETSLTTARYQPIDTPGAKASPSAHDWRVLGVTLVAAFMAVFDLYVVNIAAPQLRSQFRISEGALELVVSGYAFAYAAGLVAGGRLGDRYGYRQIFIVGMVAFTLASLLCALAGNPTQLVVFRLLQGLTAALMVPQVLSLITTTFPAAHRARATAWYGAISGVGALAGQIFGGLLLEADPLNVGWRSIFVVNVPVGLIAAVVAARILPRGAAARKTGFDALGAVGISLTLALILIPLALGRQTGWPLWTWLCLIAAVPVGLFALRHQGSMLRRGREPFINPDLFRNRPYCALLTSASLYQFYFGSLLFSLTLLVQSRLGSGPEKAALVFLLQGVLFTVASMFGGRLLRKYGARVMISGGVLVLIGLVLLFGELAAYHSDLNSGWLVPSLALIGLGNGFLLPPMIGTALSHVRPEQAGAASGTLTTSQQFANSLGVTVLGTVFFALAGSDLGSADDAMEILAVVYAVLVAVTIGLIQMSQRLAR